MTQKLMKKEVTLFQIAMHEAGHAVVAGYLSIPFEYVTIVPGFFSDSGQIAGHCRLRNWRPPYGFRFLDGHTGKPISRWKADETSVVVGISDEERRRTEARRLRKEIVFQFAGDAAERLLPRCTHEGSVGAEGDYKSAWDIGKLLLTRGDIAPSEEHIKKFLKPFETKARTLVRVPYVEHSICDVALSLMHQKTVAAKEVRRLCKQNKSRFADTSV